MNRVAFLVCLLAIAAAMACASTAPVTLTPEAVQIPVGQSDPGPGFQVISGIDAVDGSGCGAFGHRGTFNGALNRLRSDAGLLHADFVKIVATKEPYATPGSGLNGYGGCFHNEYSISAIAYRKTPANDTP